MSPNEFQLRAALRDGDDGDVPSADLAIARALRIRYERRRRITTVASAAAVVAVLGVGGTLLVRAGSGGESAGGAGGGVAANRPAVQATHGGKSAPPAVGAPTQRSGETAQADAAGTQKAFGIACPPQFPRLLLPGGGGTNQFGGDTPLFGAPVAAMKVCGYDADGTAGGSSVLSADAANDVVTQLDGGTSTRPNCRDTTSEGNLAVYAVTTAGATLRVVTVGLDCPFQATNGTAVRYLSAATVDAVRPNLSPMPNNGSPVK